MAHGASTPELNAFRGLATAHHDEEGQYALLYPSLAEPLAFYCASSNWYSLDHSAFDWSLYLALAAHPGVWGPACAFVFAAGISEQRVEIRSLAVEIMHRVLDDQLSLEDATAGVRELCAAGDAEPLGACPHRLCPAGCAGGGALFRALHTASGYRGEFAR